MNEKLKLEEYICGTGNMKNILVLKDLPSNIVDEAIVILKPNVKLKNLNTIDSKRALTGGENKREGKDYIINEAHMVIESYIGGIEEQREIRKKNINKKINKRKILKAALAVLSGLFVINLVLMVAL